MRTPGTLLAVLLSLICGGASAAGGRSEVRPVVEIEEDVYTYQEADNGAGPLWSYGSTCLARVGPRVFISGLETIPGARPLNNVRWKLFSRSRSGWKAAATGAGRTREPCPLACFPDGSLFLSGNPTLTGTEEAAGPARPEIVVFGASDPAAHVRTLIPEWEGSPPFTEHSYRSFAADASKRELVLFQNVGYTHAEWTFRDEAGRWAAHGRLSWPWGADYPEPQPIRICYPTAALKDRRVYFCGVSDIVEPYPEWRAYKRDLTGRDWDYDFRRLFFTWSDDITTGRFHDWVEVSSRDKTCGWIMPCDLWVAPDGAVHLLWTERAIDERLRERFFPGEKQTHALMYAVVRGGEVVLKRPLLLGGEGASSEIPGDGRFHVTPDGRLFVFCYVGGTASDGGAISENRLFEIVPDGADMPPVVVGLKRPFTRSYTATWRAGSLPSAALDVYGIQEGKGNTLSYARVRVGR
jgi:hypothetical protein